jgi:putative thioredoxin
MLLNDLPPPPAVKDVNTKDFSKEVMEASLSAPVVVDFWATWCGPCKQLGPILEKAVAATKGKVRMVKVDIDQNQQLAAQMGIQSIPAVFAFYQGQPVDGFMGNQPESTVKAWVERLAKLVGGKGAAGGDPLAEALALAGQMVADANYTEANEIYTEVLAHDANNGVAYAGLVQIAFLQGQTEVAAQLLADVPESLAKAKELEPFRAQLALLKQAEEAGPVAELEAKLKANPADPEIRYDLAVVLHAKGGSAAAIDHLLHIIRANRTWNEDAARKQLVTIFEALGFMHELSVEGRRKLSAILFK